MVIAYEHTLCRTVISGIVIGFPITIISLANNLGHDFPSANDSCVVDALKKHLPVIVRRTIERTDTIDYAGLIGTTKGDVTIVLFTYVTMKQDEIQVYEQHCTSEEVVIDPWNIYCKP